MLLERNAIDGRSSQTTAVRVAMPVCMLHASLFLAHAVLSGEMVVTSLRAVLEDREIQVGVDVVYAHTYTPVSCMFCGCVRVRIGGLYHLTATATGGCLSGVCGRGATDVPRGHCKIEGNSRLKITCLSITNPLLSPLFLQEKTQDFRDIITALTNKD